MKNGPFFFFFDELRMVHVIDWKVFFRYGYDMMGLNLIDLFIYFLTSKIFNLLKVERGLSRTFKASSSWRTNKRAPSCWISCDLSNMNGPGP